MRFKNVHSTFQTFERALYSDLTTKNRLIRPRPRPQDALLSNNSGSSSYNTEQNIYQKYYYFPFFFSFINVSIKAVRN